MSSCLIKETRILFDKFRYLNSEVKKAWEFPRKQSEKAVPQLLKRFHSSTPERCSLKFPNHQYSFIKFANIPHKTFYAEMGLAFLLSSSDEDKDPSSLTAIIKLAEFLEIDIKNLTSCEIRLACLEKMLNCIENDADFFKKIQPFKPLVEKLTDHNGDNLFHLLVKTRSYNGAKKWIDSHFSLREVNHQGNNALHIAAANGGIEFVSLLASHIQMNARNQEGCTPLHTAIKHGDTLVVRSLIRNGGDVFATCSQLGLKMNAAALAIYYGQTKVFSEIVQEASKSNQEFRSASLATDIDPILVRAIVQKQNILHTFVKGVGSLIDLAVFLKQEPMVDFLRQEYLEEIKPWGTAIKSSERAVLTAHDLKLNLPPKF